MILYRLKNKDNWGTYFEDLENMRKTIINDSKKHIEELQNAYDEKTLTEKMLEDAKKIKNIKIVNKCIGQINHLNDYIAGLKIAIENLENMELYKYEGEIEESTMGKSIEDWGINNE